jgi:Xaa-Pro aminopeptidase
MRHAWLFPALVLAAAPAAAQDRSPVPEPVSALPGAGRPVDLAATAARRDRLLERIGQGIVIVPAGKERDVETDVVQDNDFRQDDYFFYLTGLETPDAWLMLSAAADGTRDQVLLLPARNPMTERWTGVKLGPGADAARLSGIATVLPVESRDSVLRALEQQVGGPWYLLMTAAARTHGWIHDWSFAGRDVRNVVPVLDSLRLVKDPAELARLRRAIDITAQAHRAALRALAPDLYEYQVEAVVEYTFRNLGADRVGFPSIVGSGPNSTTLHYDANRRRMEAGDLVVVDIGAEYGQYTADVTRTFPVSGRFTDRQRAIYELVLGTQQAAIDSVRPGTTVARLNQIARAYMREHGGTLCGDRTCDAYFIHGLSHWLGMRVHDVGDYRTPLAAGMVLTIEPGIYLSDEPLGVRIEDDVLVTANGCEVLSAGAPKTVRDIEAALRGNRAASPWR